MNLSYWEKKSFFNHHDLIIVGSGIVGLSAAIHYKILKPAEKVMVIDGGIIPQGASTKNAGFACIGSAGELLSDLNSNSEDAVFGLVERRKKGLDLLRDTLGDRHINYEHLGGYELFLNDEKYLNILDKIEFFNKNLSSITGNNSTYTLADDQIKGFGFKKVTRLIKNNCEGQLNTGNMMRALLNKAQEAGVYLLTGAKIDHILINSAIGGVVLKDGNTIHSNNVLICTNGFAKELLPEITVSPARAQVLVTSPIENLKVKGSFHFDEGYYYFRNIDNRVLLGGGRNLDFIGETTTKFENTPLIIDQLQRMLTEMIIPGEKFTIDSTWSGIMGFAENKHPVIKQINPNLYCAVGLGGMGVAIGSLVGKEAVEMILR